MKWLNIIEKYLFKKDKKYMIKHIINNSNKITIDILYKIQIDKIVDNTNKLIDINQLSKILIKIKMGLLFVPSQEQTFFLILSY